MIIHDKNFWQLNITQPSTAQPCTTQVNENDPSATATSASLVNPQYLEENNKLTSISKVCRYLIGQDNLDKEIKKMF